MIEDGGEVFWRADKVPFLELVMTTPPLGCTFKCTILDVWQISQFKKSLIKST